MVSSVYIQGSGGRMVSSVAATWYMVEGGGFGLEDYRGTSLIRNSAPLGPKIRDYA